MEDKLSFDYVGQFVDNFVNKPYKLFRINAKQLSAFLRQNYVKIHGIPNIDDLNNSNFSTEKFGERRFDHVFESGYISLLCERDDFSDAVLLDGYRRLFTMNVPDFQVFVRVFNPKETPVVEQIKLMHEYNFWKIFTKTGLWGSDFNVKEYFDRGMSLFLFLKTGINIHEIIDEFDKYVGFREVNSNKEEEFSEFFKMFFENKYLFDDIKLISFLKNSKLSFIYKKKEYKDQKMPVNSWFYRDLGTLRHGALIKNKDLVFDAQLFLDSFEKIEAAQELVIDYNASTQGDKLRRCEDSGRIHAINYFLREKLNLIGKRSELEIEYDKSKEMETFKRKYVNLREPASNANPQSYDVNRFIKKLVIGAEYFIISDKVEKGSAIIDDTTSVNITGHGDKLIVKKLILKEIFTKKAHTYKIGVYEYDITMLSFLDEDNKTLEMQAIVANSNGLYIPKESAEQKVKEKRQDFYILRPTLYNSKVADKFEHLVDWDGSDQIQFYVKAKTKKRVLEIVNNELGDNPPASWSNSYYGDLSNNENVKDVMKDYPECIAYGHGEFGHKGVVRILKEVK